MRPIMTTVRWWHRPTRMASAAQFGWCILFGLGLFSAVMMVVVGYESPDWKAIDILMPVMFAVFFCASLARLFGWDDLVNKLLGVGPPPNWTKDRKQWRAFLVPRLLFASLIGLLVAWFVEDESASKAMNIVAGLILLGVLARLFGWNDLANKFLGRPLNSDGRK